MRVPPPTPRRRLRPQRWTWNLVASTTLSHFTVKERAPGATEITSRPWDRRRWELFWPRPCGTVRSLRPTPVLGGREVWRKLRELVMFGLCCWLAGAAAVLFRWITILRAQKFRLRNKILQWAGLYFLVIVLVNYMIVENKLVFLCIGKKEIIELYFIYYFTPQEISSHFPLSSCLLLEENNKNWTNFSHF